MVLPEPLTVLFADASPIAEEIAGAHVDIWRMSCPVWGNMVSGLSNDLVMLCDVSQERRARQQKTSSVGQCIRRMPCKISV